MDSLVGRVKESGVAVCQRQPPAGVGGACEMIEPRHRAIVDIESETLVRLTAKCKRDGGLDRAAMRDGDDVPARLLGVDLRDAAADAAIEIHETLAAGR